MDVPGTRYRLSSHIDRVSSFAISSWRDISELLARDDPNRMHQSWDVAQEGEQDIDPEMLAQTFLQENTKWRNNDGRNNAE